jgi:hypothetical protein
MQSSLFALFRLKDSEGGGFLGWYCWLRWERTGNIYWFLLLIRPEILKMQQQLELPFPFLFPRPAPLSRHSFFSEGGGGKRESFARQWPRFGLKGYGVTQKMSPKRISIRSSFPSFPFVKILWLRLPCSAPLLFRFDPLCQAPKTRPHNSHFKSCSSCQNPCVFAFSAPLRFNFVLSATSGLGRNAYITGNYFRNKALSVFLKFLGRKIEIFSHRRFSSLLWMWLSLHA